MIHDGLNSRVLAGKERVLADAGEDYLKLQLQLDKLQRVHWIESLADWEIMATGTFRWSASCDSATRCFERFMRRKYPSMSYYYAVECHPGGHGYHVHSLWADCRDVYRKEGWADWCKRYGWSQVERVRKKEDAASYASKYLCKPSGWWNVRLQWHRIRKVRGDESFRLS